MRLMHGTVDLISFPANHERIIAKRLSLYQGHLLS
ncbi:hypothetical protein ACVWZZ_006693 [Bradyrhizobium sp. LM6.10]